MAFVIESEKQQRVKKYNEFLAQLVNDMEDDPALLQAIRLEFGDRFLRLLGGANNVRNDRSLSALRDQIVMLQSHVQALTGALAEVRNFFDLPEPGSPLDGLSLDAMSDPLSVPDYVQAQIKAIKGDANRPIPKKDRFK